MRKKTTMKNKQNTARKMALLSGVMLFAASAASPSFAKAPYYFVDDNSNRHSLYTNTNCSGGESDCVSFGDYCGTSYSSSSIPLRRLDFSGKAKAILRSDRILATLHPSAN